ncbi:peptidase S66 LD-carboxypeptidase A [Penicillium malachiteum]|uniref:Peptidase S66 LD-carboxypeptidase A n=1 Tax=Penicillium malachiteum TaxID=1324776 RepID=A0AAD6HUG5_9EURO|nr:peptidase S66 LD-carboxypeptidase A [Penicillium malachiteum]
MESTGPLPRSPICAKEHSDFLFSEKVEMPRESVESPPWRWLGKGKATGYLFGGTIPCVVRLQGTPYAHRSWKNKILFLKSAMGDNVQLPYSVGQFRNKLVDLALYGVLNEIQGLLIGRGYKYDASMQDKLAGVIEEVFDVIVRRDRDELPILMNVDFGHTSPFLTLPYGGLVSWDSERDEFSLLEPESDIFLYTSFYKVEEDDSVFFGQIPKHKRFITPQEYTSALTRVPDDEIYPELTQCGDIRAVEDPLPSNIYLKRPRLFVYDDYKEQDAVDIIPALLLEEANTLETLSQHPNPGIIKYYGCRIKRGFITALALERHPSDLKRYIKDNKGPLNEGKFMNALESAIKHLHSIGFAHNDINPANVLLDEEKMPVLADFNSCKPIREKLTYSRGTYGWMDEADEWNISETRHDFFGMEKIQEWLKTSRDVE